MMKAFSFLTILESLSKKLSILRTKMHSDNLRVNHESITSQLRVSRPFLHCASRRTSFDLSRRASHFAAILTILFSVGVGNVWGETVLFEPTGKTITSGNITVSTGNTTPSELTIAGEKTNGWKIDSKGTITISSTLPNIKSITILGCTSSEGTGKELCGDVKVSLDGETFSTITSGVTIVDADGTQTTGAGFALVKKGNKPACTMTITFDNTQRYVQISRAASNGKQMNIASISVEKVELQTYDITYQSNGGTTIPKTEGATVIPYSLSVPTKDGCVFVGWYTDSDLTIAAVSGTVLVDNIVLYAKWIEAEEKCITFGSNANISNGTTTTSLDDMTIKSSEIDENCTKLGNNSDFLTIQLKNNTFLKCFKIYAYSSNGLKIWFSETNTFEDDPLIISLPTNYGWTQVFDIPEDIAYVKIQRESGSVYFTQICLGIVEEQSCTAPNHVDISGRWDRFGGETISLTAVAYASAGTGSPIADGDITGWQWEKLIGSTWTALSNGTVGGVTTSGATTKNLQIANCGSGNSGKYRCVVSTGATCSTASATATDGTEGFGVKVYVLECYTGGKTEHHFTRTGDSQAGTLTMNLTANTTYEFKVHVDNDYYGNNGTIYANATNWVCATTQASNLKVFSGYGGAFTFTIDYSTSGNSNELGEPEVSVTYPENKTIYVIPNGYTSDNAKLAIYYWNEGVSGWSFLTKDACSGDAYYAEIPSWTGKISIVRLNSDATVGDWQKKWNQTVDIIIDPTKDQYTVNTWCENGCNETVNEGTYTPATYTITFAGNSNTGGSMSNLTGIACGANQAITANAYTRTGYSFAGWKANVNVTIGGSTVTAGTVIANSATIQNISQNITLTAQWSPIKVSSITVAPSSKTLEVGGTQQLTATVNPDNALDKTVTWSTSNGSVATVSSTGLVTAVAEGTATITATANDGSGKTGTCSITVNKITPATYTLSADNTSICSGSDVTFTLAGSQEGATYYVTKSSGGGSAIGDSKAGTGSSLSFTVPSATAGDYYCYTSETTNYKAGKVSRSKVTITHNTATSITTQPTNQEVTVGEEATLTVVAAGTSLSYQWKESATEDGEYSNVSTGSGKTSASYSVTPAAAGTKWYKCVVTGTCGEVTTEARKIVANAAVTYTVTYDAQGGTCKASDTGSSITLPTPTKDDYTFQGWYTSGGEHVNNSPYNPTADITLHALWRSSECAGGGGGGSTTLFSTDFTESGWSSLNNTETAQTLTIGGHSVYVRANETQYLLSVNTSTGTLTWGGRNFSSKDCYLAIPVAGVNGSLTITVGNGSSATRFGCAVVEGSVIANPSSNTNSSSANPSVCTVEDLDGTSYVVFIGRQGSSNTQATSISITTPGGGSGTCYYVTYNGNGADGGFTTDESSHPSGSNVTVKTNGFTKTGYTFTGWNTAANGSGTSYAAGATFTIEADVELFAQWTSSTPAQTYSITYNCDGATSGCPENTQATNLPNPLPSAPTKTGYTFDGWYTDADKTTQAVAGTALSADITLYAKWTCTTPTISTQPINATYTQNTAAAALSVTATANNGTLSYQWQKSTDNSEFTNISGATGNEYTPSTTEVGTTYYRCVVTNTTGGCSVTSASATITVTAASVDPEQGECVTLAQGTKNNENTAIVATIGTIVTDGGGASDNYIKLSDDDKYFQVTAKNGYTIKAGDKLTVTMYNKSSSDKSIGFKIGSISHIVSITAKKEGDVIYVLQEGDINNGSVKLTRTSADDRYKAILLERCTSTDDPEPGSYTITYNLGPENWATGYTPASTYTAGTEYTLPTSGNLTNENNGEFQGWYENNTFTGDAVKTIPAEATGDKTYYAKWVYDIKFFEVVDVATDTDVENKVFKKQLTDASYPTTYTYGIGITLPALPAKDGYTADGWYSQWCVYNEQTGWVDACKSKALDNKAYGAVNFAVKYTQNTPATPTPGTGEEKYYYGHVAIQNGALVKEITNGRIQFFTVTGGVVDNSTALSMSSTPSAAGIYYNSNNLTHEELSKSSNWGSSSTANRYIQGMKFKAATTYTLKLGSKTATSIRFYGWCGSSSRKLTIGGVEYTSSSTKNTFFAHEFIKNGSFTGDVSISGSGDFYGIIVIDITSLTPCTTPVLSDLENKKVCPGNNVSWTAIVNNTATLQENGETIAYQWTKNSTVLSNDATLTLNNITEAAGGTYVVTATVSANGKASATATKEVRLTVTPATATPTITANANTIFAGNDVTLTASCASSGVTYQWYKCTDAEGTTAQIINDEENATLALTEKEAGTYYYKVIVTGDGTHSCGDAEKVYTLVVSAAIDASDCTTYFWFPYAQDATTNGVTNNENKFFGNSPRTGDSNSGTYKFELDGTTYTATKNTGSAGFTISFTVPENSIGTMAINCKGSSSKPLYLKHTDNTEILVSNSSSIKSFVIENITPGTWTLQSSGSWTLSGMAVKVCSGNTCTDPQVTATVDNAVICAGNEAVVKFTATNYADGAEFQWQKKDGNNWEKVSETTSATYTISPVTTAHAGKYRVIAQNNCKRISEEVTLTVLTAPTFNNFATEASVMKGNALAISDVQATGATGYAWYKSTDNSFDVAADTKVGTFKDLLLAAASIPEAAEQIFYLFCVASNSCGSVTSNAITVTVTPFVEEECATKGNETNDREFGFKNTGCGQGTYGDSKTPVWTTTSRSKYLTYTAPEGRYFATAKVTVAHSDKTKCGYAYSTDGGTTWTFAELDGLSTTLTAITINNLPENVNAFRISRNLQDANEKDWGVTNGTFYLAEACFTYENACTETTLTTVGSYENAYNITAGGEFTEPTFTLKAGENTLEGQTLTYTSSNPAIAIVDEEGNVEFEGMTGTVTITVAFAGATIDKTEYCACQGSYKITVDCDDETPKIIAADEPNLSGCYTSITLEAKMQNDNSFTGGTYQWYRDGEAIEGATSASYEVVRAGTYTVSRTHTCTKMSSNSAVVTNENVEPEVERLTPFQYYHVDKTYSNQMKNRHLFAVTSYGTYEGKRYHLTATRNGDPLNLSSSTAFFTIPSSDNAVDTVMIDLNELSGKHKAGDEIVITCAPINNCNTASAITASITIHVIDQTPTLALICSGANGEGTRVTKELVVGGDFLTGYNKADLCQQTGNTTFDPNKEWGFYTELKENYIVTPVNGYAEFNKLNYEPFDILLLTDYPKSSKNEAAQKVIDDMAELCDYRPLLSFKTHFQSDKWKDANGQYKYTKWVKKGFTTAPVVPAQTATYVNIVCYAHPMFDDIDEGDTGEHSNYTFHDADDPNQLVYHMLSEGGYESVKNESDKEVKKGIQGFELAAADNFVTIGLIHNDAEAAIAEHDGHTHVKWNAGDEDRLLVAMAERQTNIEARMMLFSLNAGAQSLQTEGGRLVILKCLEYLLQTDPLQVADCRFTFDNGEGAQGSEEKWENGVKPHDYQGTGYQGDGLWSTAANWGPDYNVVPGRNNDVRIAAPCIVDAVKTKVLVGDEEQFADAYFPEVLSIHITKDGSLTIPANSSLTARSTILRADEDGNVYPTNVEDISLGSNADGNASLILNNERGDTKAGVAMYSKAKAGTGTTWQYIGTPHSDVSNATYNYYNSWIYSWNPSAGWEVVPTGGAVYPWVGYCITHPEQGHTYWMEGTLVETTTQEIEVPSNSYQIIGNSWTAPIQIANFEETDFEGIETKTIYFFNTGTDPEGSGDVTANATNEARYAAGTYIVVPINAADYTGDDTEIPSMQGFYVANNNPTTAGTLHLDYERHVRAPRKNKPSGPMHAPARRVAADDEPQVAKLLVRGKRYDDKLVLLEREDFTRGYDSGWDGDKWDGGPIPPTIWAVNEFGGADAVSAIPEYEGTVIGFRAGEDSEYTIHFDYDGMEDALYLLDTDTQIYTRLLKGNSYTFTCADKAEHNRFILTRKAPQIATGTDHINTGENAKAVKFIKDDKIFIFVNGMLYDATGKIVIR